MVVLSARDSAGFHATGDELAYGANRWCVAQALGGIGIRLPASEAEDAHAFSNTPDEWENDPPHIAPTTSDPR